MLCDVCKERDAVVNVTHMEKSEMTLLRLCEKCASERGIETTVTPSTSKHLVGEVLQSVHMQVSVAQGESLRCPFCSMTLRDFRSTGRLGCARCYDTFETSLRELLRRVHGNGRHVGRTYVAPAPVAGREATLNELRDRLRRAIDNEEFESAATLRDQIKGMDE
ncbi:MAG TPA: UvrB/UvrC motif-containing protein [Gemmatimonadaceae bacterium]|jgi:protein arginine kinase activator|nr:UvrB/UvrC motif-containing protein [Gemmatimonadaceae bacterium]